LPGTDDIHALLNAANGQLVILRALYEQSIEAQQLDPELRPLIKNILENQRSALDYLAQRILDKHGTPGATKKVYYPLAYGPNAFPNWFDKNLPGVKKGCPAAHDAIRDRQPYEPGYDWLQDLLDLVNQNKHRELTPQVKAWKTELVVDPEQSGLPAERVEADVADASTDAVQATEPVLVGRDAQVGEKIGAAVIVDWRFTKPPASARGTLERIQRELPRLISDVSRAAGV
jgi:hypothetical protein